MWQLCINTANEQLQHYFNRHIFQVEMAEYQREGIHFGGIEFLDNQPTLDLFLKKPDGIFAILDEECRFPAATDLTFVEKCNVQFKNHPSRGYTPARAAKDAVFSVVHYAGDVRYDAFQFLEKNRDLLTPDVVAVFQRSRDPVLAAVFPASDAITAAPLDGTAQRRGPSTLGARFRQQLAELMDRMDRCTPYFVRCLKPTTRQAPGHWEPTLVLRQLQCAVGGGGPCCSRCWP